MQCAIIKFPLESPDGVAGLGERLREDHCDLDQVLALILKTDGNGELNDYSRLAAEDAFSEFFSTALSISREEVKNRLTFISSSGCEGLAAPHGYAVVKTETRSGRNGSKGLSVGLARTRRFSAEEIGSSRQVKLVAQATQEALKNAGAETEKDSAFVLVKGPVLNSTINPPCKDRRAGSTLRETRGSISKTRAASALGVALAMGEVKETEINDQMIGQRNDLYSKHVFAFSGNELLECRVIVFANTPSGNPNLMIKLQSLTSFLDIAAIIKLLREAGMVHIGSPPGRLTAFFAKLGVHPEGLLGGKRTALPFSDLNATRQIRAAASGLLVPLISDPQVFISSGAEHQGPPGGGLVAAVIEQDRH